MKKIPGLVILALFLFTTLACNLTTLGIAALQLR